MLFDKKIRCNYCGSKIKEATVCPACGRELKPMVSIERLSFSAIPAQELAALRAKKPGFLEKKIHAEMLEAAAEGRLRIAEAIADGILREESRDNDGYTTVYERQLIRTPEGSPVEGKFYEGLWFHAVEETELFEAYPEEPEDEDDEDYEPIEGLDINDALLHVIRYENKKGKLHYTLINAEDMDRLGEMLCRVEVPLYQMGSYEENRFR